MSCIEHKQKGWSGGYGRGWCKLLKRQKNLHVAIFIDHHGYQPEVVMHTCDNPRCINIEHLVAGTQKENQLDSVLKGRHHKSKLSPEQVQSIRRLADTLPTSAIAKQFGVAANTVWRIINNKTWVTL